MKPGILFITFAGICAAQDLKLPDPLLAPGGEKVATDQWKASHREYTLEQFRTHVYGRDPVGRPENLSFKVVEFDAKAMDGKATLKRVEIRYSGPKGEGAFMLSLFIPNGVKKPVPTFLLICNRGYENIDHTRKEKSPFWPAERVIERKYAIAAFHNSELDPDKHDEFKNGVHAIFDGEARAKDAWGTIAAWAWGASRVMDYFESDPDIDEKHVAVVGHSRGGKTALWCGAQDERFALTISNNSGCTGAALARNRKGESVARINKSFPHWFCENYNAFNGKEDDLPVDQHQLIALMAPRLVYVASATEDAWADPEGEFLACVHAGPVYELHGLKGVGATEMPKPDSPLQTGHIGYHLRTGKHNLVEYDWDRFMDFADKHWSD